MVVFQIILDRLNTIIHEAPPIPEDILVFKGLKQKFDPNFKSLFSTSMNIGTSSSFATSSCCRIYCIAKKGTKALCVLFLSYTILLLEFHRKCTTRLV